MLNKKEEKENVNVTIGRLRSRIRMYNDERSLELLEKISEDVLHFTNRIAKDNPYYCSACNAVMGDGHDCDNCAYCGTDR